jgi:O-antigen/teichoic acid export membrane protein
VLLAIAIQIAIESLRAVLLASSVWRRSLAEEATIPHVDSPLRLMIEYSLLAYACDAVHFLTYRLDVWVVRAYAGDAQLGHYDLAVRLAELVWLLAGAIAAVLFPSVANMEREDALRTVCRLGMFSVVASTVLALVGWALALVLLPRIFGSAFAPSTALLGVLLLGIVPTSGAKIIGNYLAGTGGMRFSLYSAIVGMIACVSLDFLLIPKRGALGAAIASALTYNIFTVTLFAFFKHSTQLSLPQILRYARGRSTP